MFRIRPTFAAGAALALASSLALAHEATGDHHEAPKGMRVQIEATPSGMGFTLHLDTRKFRFAPKQVDAAHRNGRGHAHLWVDGVKVTRIYGPWHYAGGLSPGVHEIRVTLNGNDHRDYVRDGQVIEAVFTGEVAMPAN